VGTVCGIEVEVRDFGAVVHIEGSNCGFVRSKTVSCENSMFQAVKRWWNESPNSPWMRKSSVAMREHAAERLVSSLRFARMTVDFLLDVVRHHSWMPIEAVNATIDTISGATPVLDSTFARDSSSSSNSSGAADKRMQRDVVRALEYLASSAARRSSIEMCDKVPQSSSGNLVFVVC
jgi:hypothetical protein